MTRPINKTGIRRLLVLADFLEKGDLREGEFDMTDWAELNDAAKLGDCGTAACAFGWATMIPSFRRAGLTLFIDTPQYGAVYGEDAAADFFDIGRADAWKLFLPDDMRNLRGARGRKTMAKRLRAFAKNGVTT